MPHHGSLQYWPHRRASKRLPRVRSEPALSEGSVANIITFKAGMLHVLMSDDSDGPSKGMEVSTPCTVLEMPKTEVYGIRLYKTDSSTGYKKAETEIYDDAVSKKLKILHNNSAKLEEIKQKLSDFVDVKLLMAAQPAGTSTGQHHIIRFESSVAGSTLPDKFEVAVSKLGKELSISDVFKSGEYVDLVSISKGKGWQGAVKRHGVKVQGRKVTQKRRHVGSLGPMRPGRVYYTVPMAGQTGFNYRTEQDKRILKLGTPVEINSVNPKSGFKNYGNIKNSFMLIKGSVPGPAKRLVRVRKSIRGRNAKGIKEPRINYISTSAS